MKTTSMGTLFYLVALQLQLLSHVQSLPTSFQLLSGSSNKDPEVSYQFLRDNSSSSSNDSSIHVLTDGEQIALEVTNQLLPPPTLSQKINEELKLIKYKYRAVSKISHQPKWFPGQLISTRISAEQIRQLNTSQEYGPLLGLTTIDLSPLYLVTVLSFSKPYNPLALGEMLRFQYGFSSSPNSIYYDGDDIFYDLSTRTYIFKQRGCGFRVAGSECSDPEGKHYWEFLVSEGGNVRLVKEYDIDGDGNRSFNLRYAEKVGN